MMPLTVRLLGPPEVAVGAQPLSFRTRKVLALLIYLVVEKGPHSRESLMALLWPESPPEKATVTLRGTLSRLRKSLQPAGDLLVSEKGRVGFNQEGLLNLDLDWLVVATLPQTPPNELVPILKLDRGEFLAGFSLPDAPGYDHWTAIQREVCQRQVESVYDRLAQYQLASRDSAAAVETASRWVARAPFSEVAHRRLMAAQALSGDRPAALKAYQKCRTILAKDFGIEPSRETVLLADQISRDRVQERSEAGMPVNLTSSPRSSPRLSLPFVGRAAEHEQLVRFYRRLEKSGLHVVTVLGAGGVGKTWLLTAFRDWLTYDSPGVEIWQGRAFEMGGRLPYQPVVEAMRRRLDRENAPEDLLDDVWLAELSQLMPELRARYPDLPPPLSGDSDFVRSRLFEALAALGSALVKRHAAVFILDDMQWAGADTLDMVHYIARRWSESGAPILLLLTVRDENFAADASLREWLRRLGRDIPLTRLMLNMLRETDIAHLVTLLSDPGADEKATHTFAAWLWAETHGLPFFMEALLQMLVEQDILAIIDGTGPTYDFAAALRYIETVARVPLPPGVRETIQARLRQLSEEARALLLAGAVLGRDCTFERLFQVAGISELEALPALETLLNGRLFVENRAVRRPYTLAHDYIREVVYSESREARRRVFHRRALLALEANRAPAAECAFHALASQLDEPALRFSLIAGDEALANWAFEVSLAHYERAREVARQMTIDSALFDPGVLRQLYQNRGRALELVEDYPAAQENYEEMRELAVQQGDRAMEVAALTAQCFIHATHTPVFNPLMARELGQQALDLTRTLDDPAAESKALWAMMIVELYGGGSSQKTADYGQRSLALARELGLKEQMGHVLVNIYGPYLAQKRLDVALAANSEALDIWRSLGNLPMLLYTYDLRQVLLFIAGNYDALLAASREALSLSQVTGNQAYRGNSLRYIGEIYALRGNFGEALAHIKASMALGEAIGNIYFNQADFHSLLLLYLFAGAPEEAERWADRLYDSLQESSMPVFQSYFMSGIARAKIARGKFIEGQERLDQALEAYDWDAPWANALIPISLAEGYLQLALGNPERVFDRDEQIRQLQRTGILRLQAEMLWLRGKAWLELGNWPRVQDTLRKAQVVAEKNGERVILWQILATLSEVEHARGSKSMAEKLREEAREIINDVASKAGSDVLLSSFLAQPEVIQVLA